MTGGSTKWGTGPLASDSLQASLRRGEDGLLSPSRLDHMDSNPRRRNAGCAVPAARKLWMPVRGRRGARPHPRAPCRLRVLYRAVASTTQDEGGGPAGTW